MGIIGDVAGSRAGMMSRATFSVAVDDLFAFDDASLTVDNALTTTRWTLWICPRDSLSRSACRRQSGSERVSGRYG